MSNLYKVNLKIGNRTVQLKLYASNLSNILTFCNLNLQGEVSEVSEVLFSAPADKIYPVDDKNTYKPVTYFNCRNSSSNVMRVISLHLIKSTRSLDAVFDDMKTYLKLTHIDSIDAHLGIKQSSK